MRDEGGFLARNDWTHLLQPLINELTNGQENLKWRLYLLNETPAQINVGLNTVKIQVSCKLGSMSISSYNATPTY